MDFFMDEDTNPLMSSSLVIFVWVGEAIWKVLNLVRNREDMVFLLYPLQKL
jgi:hypothetical protein